MNKKPTVYTVATAHLDTIWNWDFETTVREYIKNTLVDNFAFFEKYPEYKFSFEGSYRYELMEEYYPELFKKLKEYIAKERWFVAGSAFENGDVNVPSPEALFRNILYGNSYFYNKFGKKSVDIYLPDCFGFGYALPSIIAHAGLYGFTTQKLSWGSAYGIPFDLGVWYGVDGKKTYASLNGQSYSATLEKARDHEAARAKLDKNVKDYDLPFTHLLHGTGDIGGAPKEKSIETVVNEHNKNNKYSVDVEIVNTDHVFKVMDSELSDTQKAKLPTWNNELVATNHGVGSYTSRAIGKRFNKHNEQLADGAERYSCLADWLGVAKYPRAVLDKAWKRVISHQFHDDITGTSVMRAYKRSWNDYVLSLNNFSSVYESAVGRIVKNMASPFEKGYPVAVTNPTGFERLGAVTCKIAELKNAKYVTVKGANGKAVPSQIEGENVTFIASVPANGIALFSVEEANKPFKQSLSVTERTLENGKYIVTIDDNGDIASIYDKTLEKELLKKPISMAIHQYNGSKPWPAWELVYDEVMAEPIGYAADAIIRIAQNGAAIIAIETRRKWETSVFIQTISLEEGGEIVKIENEIEWQGNRKLLKTPFVLTAENEKASYDLGLGVIKRGLNTPNIYEVPAQNFADISNEEYGISVLSECKHGWDHPTADTIRLTGIHTPKGDYREDSQQSQMDLGKNRYSFAVFSHSGDGLEATQQAGIKFVQPMRAFKAHLNKDGVLPPVYSFASLSDSGVIMRAIKLENQGERIIVRVNEGLGISHKNVKLTMANGIEKAWEMNASEDELCELQVKKGVLTFDINPYEPKTFAITLKAFEGSVKSVESKKVELSFNAAVTSPNSARADGIICGATIPAELFPKTVNCKGTVFTLSEDANNAVKCVGQKIKLPRGTKSLQILLTSTNGDKTVELECGGKHKVFVPDCHEAVGAWDLYSMKEKGYIKDCTLAYEFTHMHKADGDVIAKQCYVFSAEIPAEGDELILPLDSRILIFAIEAKTENESEGRLYPMYDTLKKEKFTYVRPSLDEGENVIKKVIKAIGK